MNRPFFKSKIDELITEYKDRLDDIQFLELLVHELGFRSTTAARDLREAAAVRLQLLRGKAVDVDPPAPVRPVVDPSGARRSQHRNPNVEAWPARLLSAWTALEVLSPAQPFRKIEDLTDGDHRRVAVLDRRPLPWENGGERSLPNKKLFYQVVLGTVRMREASRELVTRYTDASPEFALPIGYTPIAVVMLDQSGIPVADDPVVISSFAWAWRPALEGRLGDLAGWSETERGLCEEVRKRLIRKSEEDDILPLDFETIQSAFNFLCVRLGLDPSVVEEPKYAIRSYQFFRIPDPPEPILLNSFFLKDLVLAREQVAAGKQSGPVRQFTSNVARPDRIDLLANSTELERALQPVVFPPGKWPAPGRHPLVTMQQAAVNLAICELQQNEAVVAVNGPPGTGKTTLLRDVCAALVTERARRLVELEDPSKAFVPSGVSLSASGNTVELHRVDERIRGFEILVASMNNRAVENISRELPGLEAIADDASHLRYLASISDQLAGKEDSTWGLISAVLGNQKNVSEFSFKGLKDEDRGLFAYLSAAAGFRTMVAGENGPRPPLVVMREKPPNGRREALQCWQVARTEFRKAVDASRQVAQELQKLREQCLQLNVLSTDRHAKTAHRDELLVELKGMSARTETARSEFRKRATEVYELEKLLEALLETRPVWWRRLLRIGDARDWLAQQKAIARQLQVARRLSNSCQAQLALQEEAQRKLASKQEHASRVASDAQRKRDELASHIESLSNSLEATPILTEQLQRAVEADCVAAMHQLAPWFGPKARTVRDEVFVAAMKLHRAFIDVAADQIRGNISALFGMASLGKKDRLPLVPHLWSTFFLVVPVASTTFASVARRFALLPPKSIGWLLIDEAGQAPPQAAVGAMMRCQRALVVGDPLQIEPVVPLPEKLIEAVCQYYEVERDRWAAPNASVQTLADANCKYSSIIRQASGAREVGLALIVHRRCQSPMFEISNYVAYGGQMVQGTPAKTISGVLGRSRWFDVSGTSVGKWSEEEGRVLVSLLDRLLDGAETVPDVFVISPFRNVASRLKALVNERFGETAGYGWWRDRVGTIHTFQGKQASIVFLVLGAAGPSDAGARRWAAGTPNIVNVAASRAKDLFYVVGNHSAWHELGAMRVAAAYLPRDEQSF